jgi:hypothetical protein
MTSLRQELQPFASSGREASRLVEEICDGIVVALRRDPRFAGISLREYDLILADVRKVFERRLFNELANRIHLDFLDHIDGVGP